MRSDGCDWSISETHADAIFSGLRKFGEYPFFSFAFNGGSYFLQDPQSNLFSPVVPLTVLVGPTVALRLMTGVWGALGVYLFTSWMRRRVSVQAALLGGLANVSSLGVLWRIAVGNDMFLWHLGLPGLLWSCEKLMRERTPASVLWFGLALGLMLLGPTYGSFVFLILPVMFLFVIAEWLAFRPNSRESASIVGLGLVAFAIAALIASPKLASWLTFSMTRPVEDYGPIPLREAVRNLLDFSIVKHHIVYAVPGLQETARGWGVEEAAVALQPVAALLALVGVFSLVWRKAHRRLAIFGLLLITVGLFLSCSWTAFEIFRGLSNGGFRVVQRFMAVSAFGLVLLATLGADALFSRMGPSAWLATSLAGFLMLGSVAWWTHAAGSHGGTSHCDSVYPDAIDPIARFRDERDATDDFRSYTRIRRFPGVGRDFLKGGGYSDGFLIVGNEFEPKKWSARHSLPIVAKGADDAGSVALTHLRVKIFDLKPGGKVALRIRLPAFGWRISTIPTNAHVHVDAEGGMVAIENTGQEPIRRVVLRAKLPFSAAWFVVSGLSLATVLGALVLLIWRKSRPRKHYLALQSGGNRG